MPKKSEQITYQSNSKGYIVDIKIDLNNFKASAQFPDIKANADAKRKSSYVSKSSSKSNNNVTVMNYLNNYADVDKSRMDNLTSRDLNEASQLLSGYRQFGTANGKHRPMPNENNEAFKYLKNRLANKHYEAISRPSFNVAGISPVVQNEQTSTELYDRKIAKRY